MARLLQTDRQMELQSRDYRRPINKQDLFCSFAVLKQSLPLFYATKIRTHVGFFDYWEGGIQSNPIYHH